MDINLEIRELKKEENGDIKQGTLDWLNVANKLLEKINPLTRAYLYYLPRSELRTGSILDMGPYIFSPSIRMFSYIAARDTLNETF